MGAIYEVRRFDRLRCHDIHTKFHKDWFCHSKDDAGDTQTQTLYKYVTHCVVSSVRGFPVHSWVRKLPLARSYRKHVSSVRLILLKVKMSPRSTTIKKYKYCFTHTKW
jgi:hypothetical protein